MTDEAKALVERLREENEWTNQRPYFHAHSKCLEAADRIETLETQLESANEALRERLDICETQAREIERLRVVLDNIAHESSDTWARRDACVALGIDWPETRRQP